MDIKELIKEDKLTIVDFWAEWCGPCKKMSSIIDKLKDKFPDINVHKIDVEEEIELTSEYKVKNVPTIIFFKNNEILDRVVGAISIERLEAIIKTLKQ